MRRVREVKLDEAYSVLVTRSTMGAESGYRTSMDRDLSFRGVVLEKHHDGSRGLVLPEQFAEYPRRMEQEPETNDGAALTASKTPSRYRSVFQHLAGIQQPWIECTGSRDFTGSTAMPHSRKLCRGVSESPSSRGDGPGIFAEVLEDRHDIHASEEPGRWA